MPRGKLFESWTFSMECPFPFDNPRFSGQRDFGRSMYNRAGSVPKASLHAPSLMALIAYAKLTLATAQGDPTTGLGAIGHQDSNYYVAEYPATSTTDCVVFNPGTGKFIAQRRDLTTDKATPYTVGKSSGSGAALLFALMPTFETDEEFSEKFADFKAAMADGWPDMDAAYETALCLCDNMYRRIENAQNVGSAGIKLSIPTTGNISNLSPLAIDHGSYTPTGVLYGDFVIFTADSSRGVAKVYEQKDFVGQYAMTPRFLTQREQAMVPRLPDWYIIPREVVRVCEHAKLTTTTSQPMRNFLFRGEAGTGKTMGAQAIAAGLGLPYTLMTCSANTEITDLIGQFIPDADKSSNHDSAYGDELPSVSDIVMHPPSIYMALTGEYDESKTEDDVLQELIQAAVRRLSGPTDSGGGQRIRYVDTPLIEAIRHGYVCEIQEPSCIANPGVLVGLNSLLDNCQEITLPTGERIQRHPDTVIIVTTNSDYAGCRDMNQSIISRMDLIYDVASPDLPTMVKRVMNVTGYSDEQEATRMAIVVRDIAERCRQTMITDGSCGMREYKSWVLSTMITGDPYESALSTVIASASADPDNRADLMTTCLEKQYVRNY